jgi:hypothetical protein
MATAKTTNRRTPRTRTASKSTATTAQAKRDPSLATRTGKAIAKRPVASAAIGTGLVAGIAAAVAGFLAFKKSGKTFAEFSDDVATSVKDKAKDASTFVKDGISDAKSKAQDLVDRRKDGVDADTRSQEEIAEEALTLKATGSGTKGKRPVDPVVDAQTKVGAISY